MDEVHGKWRFLLCVARKKTLNNQEIIVSGCPTYVHDSSLQYLPPEEYSKSLSIAFQLTVHGEVCNTDRLVH